MIGLGGAEGHADGVWNDGLMNESNKFGPDFGCIHHEEKKKEIIDGSFNS